MNWEGKPLPKLRYVKFTVVKGHLYAYFSLGVDKDGKVIRTALPRFGTEEFYAAYAEYMAAREPPNLLSFDPTKVEAEKARARQLATASLDRENGTTVYFVQSDTGEIKIGIATDVEARLSSLRSAHSRPLALLATAPGGGLRERQYHHAFRNHRLRGEWFAPAPEILAEIARLNENRTHKRTGKPALNPAEKAGV